MSVLSKKKCVKDFVLSNDVFVFDFDGVLVDSAEIKSEAFAQLYGTYGDKDAVDNIVNHHRNNGGMSRFDKFRYYHKVFLEKKITEEDLLALGESFSNIVTSRVILAQEINGTDFFLSKYCKHNKKCIINSATPQKEISEIVKQRSMSDYFFAVYGSPSTKVENLYKLLSGYDASKIVFFGDAKSDIEAAIKVGVNFVGVGEYMIENIESFNAEFYAIEDFAQLL